VPTSIDIPAIGVHSNLLKLGQQNDGSIEVPPLGRDSVAGWYDKSPTPGQLGPAVVLGHVDSKAYGPAVFYRLGALKAGDRVSIHRSDGLVALFHVDQVTEYAKTKFPTRAVYGNIDHAGLRLITCGGTFNPSVRSYDDNIVVYASLIGTSRTT
jgi:sortase (surface protein transpeptidase)